MQFSKWKIGAVALVCMLLPGSVHAQIVKNERLLSLRRSRFRRLSLRQLVRSWALATNIIGMVTTV